MSQFVIIQSGNGKLELCRRVQLDENRLEYISEKCEVIGKPANHSRRWTTAAAAAGTAFAAARFCVEKCFEATYDFMSTVIGQIL